MIRYRPASLAGELVIDSTDQQSQSKWGTWITFSMARRNTRAARDLQRKFALLVSTERMTRQVVRRKRKQLLTRWQEMRILSLILVIVALPTLGAVFAITVSSRPSLEKRMLVEENPPGKPQLLDWPTLDRLYKGRLTGEDEVRTRLSQDVRVPGYMIPYNEAPEKGKVTRFLLVPDCGNWLHPPHRFDSSGVVVVLMNEGRQVPLIERSVLVVTGRLSFEATKNDWAESGLVLRATDVSSGVSPKFRN